MAFNPKQFGITVIERRAAGRAARGCYLRFTNPKNKAHGLELVIERDAYELIVENFGERVDAGVDNKGRIFLWKSDGVGRKVSCNQRVGATKAVIALHAESRHYMELMGKFARQYMDYDLYAGGEAIVFTPTGEKDMV